MTTEPSAVTATMQSLSRSRLAAVMVQTLESLRPFLRAYARTPEEHANLPPLELVWVVEHDKGPERALLDAIKSSPELWTHAVPAECCIVPREVLKQLIGDDAAEGLVQHGAALVQNYAARVRYATERARDPR